MILSNYHSHTHYCDGTDAPEVYVLKALELGLSAYGFSSHAPIPYPIVKWCMNMEKRKEYCKEIAELKQKYEGQIQLYCGMEVDYIPDEMGVSREWIKELNLDYTVGSIHFVNFEEPNVPWEIDGTHEVFKRGLAKLFGNNIKLAVEAYYTLTKRMILEDKPTILGHMDKIKMHNSVYPYFQEDDSWYRSLVMDTLDLVSRQDVMVEVNTRGIYKKKTVEPYPSLWILKEIKRLGIPVVLNSDGHHPNEIVGSYDLASEFLIQAGIKETWHLLENKWSPQSI